MSRARWSRAGVVGWTVLFVGCMSAEARSGLTNSRGSAEELVQDVLDAFAAKDRPALEAFMVTADEHRDLLFEQLPESNTWPFAFVRELNMRNSMKGLGKSLTRFGGQRFELLSIEYTKGAEVYGEFTLHRGAMIHVRRVTDGLEGTLPILDVILERRGRWKLMNYEE